jgi:diadenosine tetraphosphate (Ap4A) HIT family hydrolase
MPGIADALAKNTASPVEALTPLAPLLSSAGIQSLLDNLGRLTDDPELGVALAETSAATPEQQELLQEITADVPIETKELEDVAKEAEPDVKKRQTLLQKVAAMNIVQRIQRAVKGGREERLLLIRDPNKIVQRAVLQSPRLTDLEVEAFAAMANVSQEVLRIISANRAFMKSYVVVKNLTKNPKTPLDVSMHLLARLTPTDLKFLTGNKNVPETLRTTALKLQRSRNTRPSGE